MCTDGEISAVAIVTALLIVIVIAVSLLLPIVCLSKKSKHAYSQSIPVYRHQYIFYNLGFHDIFINTQCIQHSNNYYS
jgi:hypothetical protein